MIAALQKNIRSRHLANVRTILGTPEDPKLPKDTVDLVLLVDVYHEFSEPEKMLDRIRESLKPDGRLVLLEYRAEDPSVPILSEHKMTVAEVRAEVQPEGFRFDKTIEVLPQQHIIVFRREQLERLRVRSNIGGRWLLACPATVVKNCHATSTASRLTRFDTRRIEES